MLKDMYDILILCVVTALLCVNIVSSTITLSRKNLGGFDVEIEKTAMKIDGDPKDLQNWKAHTLDKDDIILMMAITENNNSHLSVNKIRITEAGSDIVTDANFVSNPMASLSSAYNYMNTLSGAGTVIQFRPYLYVDSSGMQRWVMKP